MSTRDLPGQPCVYQDQKKTDSLGEHTGQDAERVGNLTCQEEGCFSTVF